ncbi:Uncharacterised protein [Mycolicibacterium flavescens]|uniref:T3SS (YopN, CesT) and YbjN peptide-binding chaperone 1 n=1 Tax=Mycobacterium neumannii TaxID=2048551 RepID=UPI000F6CB091|nr:YbjN domain-containing protein [Mycobacterium neumannii]VEG45357.1 Uncharacterised protein [Mycolicibacterium flavescens]
MTRQRVYKQITTILDANSLTWTETATGGVFLRFSSAGVAIELANWGEQTLIRISSNALSDVDGPTKLVLKQVNRLNMETQFGRWVYYKDARTITIEYDLLGDHLQENELMTSLAAVARAADHQDDQLQSVLGGRRAFEEQ